MSSMLRFLAGFCLILASGVLVYLASPLPFYLLPKQDRLYSLWQKDFSSLAKNAEFKEMLSQLAKVEIHFNDPQVADEFGDFKSPFRTSPQGLYTLKINITRWIEPKTYGFIIEHELFDSTDDKVHEFGRTYRVGYIF